MELRHLRYLVAIADAGTFVRAAEQVHVAQPALTRQMHDLEKELEVDLFDAKARKATLTAAGVACVRIARHVIQDTEQAVARARLSNSGVVGRCVVATGPFPLRSGLVAQLVARLRARFPGITIGVEEISGTKQWQALADAQADIGLGVTPTNAYPSLTSETQSIFAIDSIVVAPDHPLASRASITLKELRDTPFLALEADDTNVTDLRAAVTREMKRRHFSEVAIAGRAFPSFESLLGHIRAGQGWTVFPSVLAVNMAGLAHVPLEDFRAPLRTVRIWRRADHRPVIQTVIEQLRQLQKDRAKEIPAEPTVEPVRHDFVPARLDLRHIRSFATVAKQGSLGRAAETLEVTQPALSRQMQELEFDVGVPLLDRQSRGVDLTPAGETFLGDVRSILSVVDHLPREARRAVRGTTQRCIVGMVPHPYAERMIVTAMKDLESRGARVRVGVRPVTTMAQASALRAGEIDVGMGHAFPVTGPIDQARGLIVQRLFDDRISTALLAPSHPLASRDSLACHELADVPFIWPGRSFFPRMYDTVFETFAQLGVRPRTEGEFPGLDTIWSLVGQGLGWTLGWESHLTEPPTGLRAVPLRDFSLSWGGELVYLQDEARAPVLATIDAIIALAKQLTPAVSATQARLPSAHTSEAAIP